MSREAELSRDGSPEGWVAAWVAEAIPRRHHQGPLAPAASAVISAGVRASEAASREVAAVEAVSAAQSEDSGAVVGLAVVVIAVAPVPAHRTAMPLLMPQQDQGPTIGLGVPVNVTVNRTVTDKSVVGITRALVPAHLMTDLVDPRRDTTEIDEQALTSSLSVTGASTVTTTAATIAATTAPEKMTPGNVGSKASTRTPARFAATSSPLSTRHLAAWVGMWYIPISRKCYSDLSFFYLPFLTKGKQRVRRRKKNEKPASAPADDAQTPNPFCTSIIPRA